MSLFRRHSSDTVHIGGKSQSLTRVDFSPGRSSKLLRNTNQVSQTAVRGICCSPVSAGHSQTTLLLKYRRCVIRTNTDSKFKEEWHRNPLDPPIGLDFSRAGSLVQTLRCHTSLLCCCCFIQCIYDTFLQCTRLCVVSFISPVL